MNAGSLSEPWLGLVSLLRSPGLTLLVLVVLALILAFAATRTSWRPGTPFSIVRRRRWPLWPLLAFPVMVTLTGVLIYGVTRFRFAAEPALCVLAAVAVAAAANAMKMRVTEGISQSQSTAA